MIINGVELEVDFTDADFIEKIDEGRKRIMEQCDSVDTKNLSKAEGIRQECKIIKDFFDFVFGDGTSEKLFKGKNSLDLCFKAFEDIIDEREKSIKDFYARVSKYSPDRLKR